MNRRILVLVCVCYAMIACGANAQCTPVWTPLGTGVSQEVHSITSGVLTQGSRRPAGAFVAGFFWAVGSSPWFRVALWDGAWHNMQAGAPWEEGIPYVGLIPGRPSSGSSEWIVGGAIGWENKFPGNIVRWRPPAWSSLGDGVWDPQYADFVFALAEYDDGTTPEGSAVYVGGVFTRADGIPCNGLARWDGSAWWVPPEQPATNAPFTRPTVYALAVYDDDGASPRRPGLYVAGSFDKVGELPADCIARWDGQGWEALAGGTTTTTYSLCVFDDDGPGPRAAALFAAGDFFQKFARWDGHEWTRPPGTGLNSNARAMVVWDEDGPGPNEPALYATGFFTPGIARWRGVGHGWETVGALSGGIGGISVGYTLCPWDEDGPGPNPGGLYVGGQFKSVNGVPANFIARWGCPLPPGGPCYPDCNSDGTLDLADFGCFSTKFATGDPYADCNADGLTNLADFGCFQTRFALGCL